MSSEMQFVDFFDSSGGRRRKWVRWNLLELIDKQESLDTKEDIFVTAQMFGHGQQKDGERHLCPLFFDIDNESLETALDDTQSILQHLTVEMEIPPELLLVKFSGKKGFHIQVSPHALGNRVSVNATAVAKTAASEIARTLHIAGSKEGGSFDRSVYSVRRMLRIPGSLRSDSRRAAVIDANALLEMTVEDVLAQGAQARVDLTPLLWPKNLVDLTAPAPEEAMLWYGMHEDAAAVGDTLNSPMARGFKRKSASHADVPICMKSLMETKLRKGAGRNQQTFILAVAMRELGWFEAETDRVLATWTEKTHAAETGLPCPTEVKRNAASTVRSAFTGDKKPVCKAILALGSNEDPIQCSGAACEFGDMKAEARVDWSPPEVSLHTTRRPEGVGRKVRVQGTVCQRDPATYYAPRLAWLECTCDKDECGAKRGKERAVNLQENAHLQLAYVGAADGDRGAAALVKALRDLIKPSCRFPRLETEGHLPLILGSLQPVMESGYSGESAAFTEFETWFPAAAIDPQGSYEMVVEPLPHPKTRQHTLMGSTCRKVDKAHEGFELTTDVLERLDGERQPKDAEGILLALTERHRDFAAMHGIRGRVMESLAISLVWHSVLSFRFQGKQLERGWLETLVVGDTAQGKTEMVRGFLRWFGLGNMISGENVTLAGLTAGVEQRGGRFQQRFGAFVRADTTLSILDEVHAMKAGVMQGLSDVRSKGLVQMEKIASAQAQARVRKVFIANPIKGKGDNLTSVKMDRLNWGVEAVIGVMRSQEDTRRLDFAVGLKRRPDLLEEMNRPSDAECSRDQRTDQDLVLWAWSRTTDQVHITKEATAACLRHAVAMSDRFGCDDIPLVDPGEARIKIARLACAVAASVFSASADGETLEVHACHVEVAIMVLTTLYQSPDLNLEAMTEAVRNAESITEDEAVAVANSLHLVVGLQDTTGVTWIGALKLMQEADGVGYTAQDLLALLPLAHTEVTGVLELLARRKLIRKGGYQGFVLTTRGLAFCRWVDSWSAEPDGIFGRITKEVQFGGVPGPEGRRPYEERMP